MKLTIKYILLALLMLLIKDYVIAQNDEEKIIIAYINNFAKYTTWPNENQLDSFKIALVTENKAITREFEEYSQKRQIKNRPISVTFNSPDTLSDKYQMIVIMKNKKNYLDKIYDYVEGKPVLLVSEEYNDKRFVMINMYKNTENQLLFEINKANVLNQNLTIDPEILLAGGTEIDVAGLYRKSQINLRSMQKRIENMEDSLEYLNLNIQKSLNQIKQQQSELADKKKILEKSSNSIDSMQRIFHLHDQMLNSQKDSINIKNKFLNNQILQIEHQRSELNIQEKLLESKQNKIDTLNSFIDSLNFRIESKNTTLLNQDDIIQRQRLVLKLTFVIGVLFIFLVVTIFIAYRNNKIKSEILIRQKVEIEEKLNELKKLNNKLKITDQYKSVFLASMSHELRTPLNSIIGYTGILLMGMTGDLNEEQKKQLTKVKNNANHLLSLINDILDISKIEAGKVELNNENFKLIDVVNDVVESLTPAAKEKQIEISTDINKYLIITTDKRRIKQVILNLVSNAVKYNNAGTVHIYTDYLSDNKFRLSVKDTGIGISETELARLFQPFQQIDSSLTRKNSGTGLGLYLCRKLMSLLGGYISVNSELGKGSVFYIEMPVKI